MPYFWILVIVLLMPSVLSADTTYSWEDADGIHFTDDPSSVPVKQKNVKTRDSVKSKPALPNNQQSRAVDDSPQQKPPKVLTESRKAVDALNKIQARAQIGITNKDYYPVLGEAQYSVNKYLASKEADKYGELAVVVKSAMSAYVDTGVVWDVKFSRVPIVRWLDPTTYEGKKVLSYPGMSSLVEYIPGTSTRMIYIDNVIGRMLAIAGEQVAKANTILAEIDR